MTLEEILTTLFPTLTANPELIPLIVGVLVLAWKFAFPYIQMKLMTLQSSVLKELATIAIRYVENTMDGKSDSEKRNEAIATLQQMLRDKGLGTLADNIPRLVEVIESLLNQNEEHPPTDPATLTVTATPEKLTVTSVPAESTPLVKTSTPVEPLSEWDVMNMDESQIERLKHALTVRENATFSNPELKLSRPNPFSEKIDLT